ncbi:MAG: helix-turn-helix transcriptional regulator [Rubrivivax sp.]|nr:helix-turn-helix transcriptional regulator [Rubrivivax sp.]
MPRYEPRLARLAALIADPARSRMLAYLLDGHRASAGELATAASVAPSTASGHLARLAEAGLVAIETRGRHRYVRLADADVAHALEALAMVAERGTHERLWNSPARAALREARCCYGHLAGRLGVGLMEALQREGRTTVADDGGLALTDAGRAWLQALGVEPDSLPPRTARRRWAYPCLDWSERRDHLAGALATWLLDHFISQDWLRPQPGGREGRNRALTLTHAGQRTLLPLLQA